MTLDGDIRPRRGRGVAAVARKLTLRDYLEALRLARTDRRIKGLLVAIDGPSAGREAAGAARRALDFQKAEVGGRFSRRQGVSRGERDYYLATACGRFWLSPRATSISWGCGPNPLHPRHPRPARDRSRHGSHRQVQVGDDTVTDKQMNEAFRESMDALVGASTGR